MILAQRPLRLTETLWCLFSLGDREAIEAINVAHRLPALKPVAWQGQIRLSCPTYRSGVRVLLTPADARRAFDRTWEGRIDR
jgi:hypothetical protein